jgi:O-antigen ligase
LLTELQQLKEHKLDNSLGFRMQFHEYASSLFLEHPIKGQGTGSFKYRFSQDLPIPSWGNSLTEPHSQYWMTLAEMGLIGISFLMLFLGSLFFVSLKLKETKPILLGFLVVFSIACFSDTVFCYSVLGYLLIVLSALCFGEMLQESHETS